MLKNRIISTLNFFNLQDYPLTLMELQKFLIADLEKLNTQLDSQGEILSNSSNADEFVSTDKILECLDTECKNEVNNSLGFYFLPGREAIVNLRLNNYFYGITREKLIRKFLGRLKYIPFVRGVGLAGSQAMGLQKSSSDIDLLIITDPRFLWLVRTLVTAYFQILRLRRHGLKIQNRFCLNHYLAGPKKIIELRNLYTAFEYLKLRPTVYGYQIAQFQKENSSWLNAFFPNAALLDLKKEKQNSLQRFLEKPFSGFFAAWVEKTLKNWQLPKIRQEKFIVVTEDELSFHPDSKQQVLLRSFFGKF